MKRILAVIAVLLAIEIAAVVRGNVEMESFVHRLNAQAVGRPKEIAGDHYFTFGTSLQKVLWTLQRRYPEYTRRVLTDDEGYTDLEEFHRFIFFHYYFKDKKYIGSTTTFHRISKSTPEDQTLFNGLVKRLKKVYGVEPKINSSNDSYSWEDEKGNMTQIDVIASPADTFITVRSMSRELVNHPVL